MRIWSRHFPRTPLLLLAVAEAIALFVSVYIAASIVLGRDSVPSQYVPKAAALAGVILLSLIAMGLYQFHKRINFNEMFIRIIVSFAVGSLVMAIAYYSIPALTLQPRIAATALVCALMLLLIVRFIFMGVVDKSVFRRRTLVLGAGDDSLPISNLRRRADRRGFVIVGQLPAPGDRSRNEGENLLETDESILETARQLSADEIVIAMDERRGNLPIRELLDCKLSGIDVIDLMEFLERETGKVPVDLVSPGWLIFSPGFRITKTRRVLKRVFDLSVGGFAILLTWPLMLGVALAIKISDGWDKPVIYKQRRLGYRGREFDVFKFRSMVTDAEHECGAKWAEVDDARITKVGAILRDFRLDELPQIINVLKGDMSIVGPRPERPEFVRELERKVPYYDERHTVMPGLTGWAQMKFKYGASEDDALEKLKYDLYYVKNNSLILDLMIILQTTEVILWRIGAR